MRYSPPLSPGLEPLPGDDAAQLAARQAGEVLLEQGQEGAAVGMVFALRSGADGPYAAIRSGGIAIIARQIRQLKALGVERIVLVTAPGQSRAVEIASHEAARDGLALEVADRPGRIRTAIGAGKVLAIDEGLLVDERMLEAFLAGHRPPATRPLIALHRGSNGAGGAVPAGLAIIPPRAVTADLAERLHASALSDLGRDLAASADLSGLDTYAANRRRHLPMVWLPLRSAADGTCGTRLLIDSAQKGCLDWPARFIHPPVENLVTRLLLPTPVTPNMVSVFIFFTGIYAAWSFATGGWALALVLAIIIGPLDGVDGKLARTRMDFSRWGDLEHVADKIVEYLCYIGMAAWIGAGRAWAVCALVVLFALAEAVQGEFYRRITGGQLDDAGEAERRFRLFSGRRNTFMWTLIPFVALGAWEAGFVMIAVYSVATFFFMQWRFYVRLGEVARRTSPVMAENLRRTAYAFLKEGGKD